MAEQACDVAHRHEDLESQPGLDAILAQAGGENFPVALRLLRKRYRHHLLSVYAFARLTDDIGDEASGDRLALLDALEVELDRAFAGQARHPVLQRLQPTLVACDLPRKPFADLIDANRFDQGRVRIADWEALRGYCALSANPVGRLVLHVFGVDVAPRAEPSDAVCTALQVVEHCQDVREDYEDDRVYLPATDLERFGVRTSDLAARPHPPSVQRTLRLQVDRARTLLAEAPALVASLSGGARLAVAGFAAGGMAAADAIERAGFDTSAGAPRARRRDILRHALRLLWGSRS